MAMGLGEVEWVDGWKVGRSLDRRVGKWDGLWVG